MEVPPETFFTLKVYNVLGEMLGYMYDSVGSGKMKFRLDSLYNYEIEIPFAPRKALVPDSIFESGIYFYKLEADEFTDTKKMILLK